MLYGAGDDYDDGVGIYYTYYKVVSGDENANGTNDVDMVNH